MSEFPLFSKNIFAISHQKPQVIIKLLQNPDQTKPSLLFISYSSRYLAYFQDIIMVQKTRIPKIRG